MFKLKGKSYFYMYFKIKMSCIKIKDVDLICKLNIYLGFFQHLFDIDIDQRE